MIKNFTCFADEVTCILLEQGADSDALDNNSQLGHFEVARVLLKHGTDMNFGDINNWAPLHEASKDGHSKVVHFLLDHGANVQALDLGSWTLQTPHFSFDLFVSLNPIGTLLCLSYGY